MNNLPHDARRILAFPKRGNIYTERLYDAVEARGVIVIEGEWSSRWLRRHVRPNDLIHIHWPSFLYFDSRSRVRTGIRLARLWVLMKWAKRHGATIVWTAHNLYPHEGNQSLLEHRLGRKITVALADYVVVHGPSAAALVAKEFGIPPARLRIGYHPNWIGYYPNTSTYDQCRAKLNVRPDEYLYVHLGRCKPYKGLETLIDAFRRTASGARRSHQLSSAASLMSDYH